MRDKYSKMTFDVVIEQSKISPLVDDMIVYQKFINDSDRHGFFIDDSVMTIQCLTDFTNRSGPSQLFVKPGYKLIPKVL